MTANLDLLLPATALRRLVAVSWKIGEFKASWRSDRHYPAITLLSGTEEASPLGIILHRQGANDWNC